MLKKILDKTAFDALHEELQKLYKIGDDQKFHLQLEDDDAEPLRRAKDHEVGLRKLAEQERDQIKVELTTAQTRITELERTQSSTTQELRADHAREVQALKDSHAKDKSGLENTIKKIFVGDVAHRIASEIAIDEGAAELLSESIGRRLSVEMVNGEPVTRVLNADGTASNKSPDELKNEYLQMKKFAGILRASEASGGGATGGGKGGGAPGKKLADLGDEERTKMARENPVEFQRLVDAAKEEGSQ